MDRNRALNDIITAVIALAVIVFGIVAYAVKGELPGGLLALLGIVVGYYFGRAQASSREVGGS